MNDFLADNGLHDGNPIIAAGAHLYATLLELIAPPEGSVQANGDLRLIFDKNRR